MDLYIHQESDSVAFITVNFKNYSFSPSTKSKQRGSILLTYPRRVEQFGVFVIYSPQCDSI